MANLHALEQAFRTDPPLSELPTLPQEFPNLTVQQYVDRIMRTRGYRQREVIVAKPGSGTILTRWRR